MKASELSRIIGGHLKGRDLPVTSFSIDTRTLKPGQVFVALKGSRHDGHSFVKEAFRKGALGVISEVDLPVPEGRFLVKVNSTTEALRKIARHKREKFRGKVIAVAGSAGKTTTKELIAHLLSLKGRVFKTPGNLNSQIGLPLALTEADEKADFWVLELGASRLGEVKRLTELVEPHVRVITALGEEHLEGFGSLENVIKGNGEIFLNFGEEDFAVIPDYARKFYDLPGERVITFGPEGTVRAQEVRLELGKTVVRLEGEEFSIPLMGFGVAENFLASVGVLKALGYEPRDFKETLKTFRGMSGRMELISFGDFYVINDSYNSNPLSLRKALQTLKNLNHPKKILLLGDMLELGEKSKELHEEVGHLVRNLNPYFVIFFGKEMYHAYKTYGGNAFHTEDWEELTAFIKERGEIFKNALIFIKGSRGMKLERVLDVLGG